MKPSESHSAWDSEWISALLMTARGKTTDARGIRGLSCRLAFGRMARHHEVNDLVWRALCKANVPSVKESSRLVRDDGKRPDGSTLIPWHADKSVVWDITVVNTLAESYLSISASPVGPAEHAVARKSAKTRLCHLPTSTHLWLWRFLALWTPPAFHSWAADWRALQETHAKRCIFSSGSPWLSSNFLVPTEMDWCHYSEPHF